MKRFILSFMIAALMGPLGAGAEESGAFKKYNPDGYKFEFARSYIASLGYLDGVEKRWEKSADLKKESSPEEYVAWNIERLNADNTDVRIAKNYLTKYFASTNPLMRKVTDSYVFACDQLVGINQQERELWEGIKRLHENDKFSPKVEEEFKAEQERLGVLRQEALRGIVTSAVLMTKVLWSEDTREKDVVKRLAISTAEREKLVTKLDSYAKDNLDWSLKPGQTYIQAAEASVREVLEDSFYRSADE